jgi:hypothetical protein
MLWKGEIQNFGNPPSIVFQKLFYVPSLNVVPFKMSRFVHLKISRWWYDKGDSELCWMHEVLVSFLGWNETVRLVRRPLIGILYQPRMIDEYGTVGGMRIGRRNRNTRRKLAPMPLCPSQIPHDLSGARTWAVALESRWLTTWAMARPTQVLKWAQSVSEPCTNRPTKLKNYSKCASDNHNRSLAFGVHSAVPIVIYLLLLFSQRADSSFAVAVIDCVLCLERERGYAVVS